MVNRRVIQLGIAVVGIIIALLLFSLPKFVVENNKAQIADQENKEEIPENIENAVMDDMHQTAVSSPDEARIDILRKNVVDNSENPDKMLIFADSLAREFEKGFSYDSAAHYRELIYRGDKSLINQIKLANAYFAVFQYTISEQNRSKYALKARGLYEEILEKSSSEDLQTRLAVTKVYTEAPPMVGINELKGLIKENPDNLAARLYLSEFMLTVQRLEPAKEQLKEILKRDPENIKANLLLAECLIRLGNKVEAQEQLQQITSLNTSNDPYIKQFVQEKLDILKSL